MRNESRNSDRCRRPLTEALRVAKGRYFWFGLIAGITVTLLVFAASPL